MPTTTQADFDALRVALENDDIEELNEILQTFDLTATDALDRNCLVFGCMFSASPELLKTILKKIVRSTGSTELLKSQLKDYHYNCLSLSCSNYSSDKVMKLAASLLAYYGFFQEQYAKLDDDDKVTLRHNLDIPWDVIRTSWRPDARTIAEIEQILERGSDEDDDDVDKDDAADAFIAQKKAEAEAAMKTKSGRVESDDDDDDVDKDDAADAFIARKKAEAEAAGKTKLVTSSSAHATHNNSSTKSKATTAQQQKQTSSSSPDQQKRKEQDASVYSVGSIPPSRCFKRGVPDKNLEGAITSLFSIKEAPSNRPDLKNWIPDKEDASDLLHYLNHSLAELKKRPVIQKLITQNHLTDDDIKILHSYKIQNPFPVYLWLNGWLGGDRRDDFVKEHVAPFFVLLYRAMEKLPRVKTVADRAIKVNGIASLKNTYDNYKIVCAPKSTLSFWGFSSFSTESDVVNREEFVGKPQEEAIVYSCGELEGVDMEPFAPQGLKSESEILPLCPCVLEVQTSLKIGQKLVVSVKQLDHADFSYVAPK